MNHIALTVADLRTERTKLDEMIALLERYSAARFETEPTPPLAAPAQDGPHAEERRLELEATL